MTTPEGGINGSEPELVGDTAASEGDMVASESGPSAFVSEGGSATTAPANTSTTWDMEGRAEALGAQHACNNVHKVSDITCPSGAVGLFGLAPLTIRRGT